MKRYSTNLTTFSAISSSDAYGDVDFNLSNHIYNSLLNGYKLRLQNVYKRNQTYQILEKIGVSCAVDFILNNTKNRKLIKRRLERDLEEFKIKPKHTFFIKLNMIF